MISKCKTPICGSTPLITALFCLQDYGNYAFSYDIHAHGGSNGRKESGSPHGVVGSYYLGVGDGRHRSVQYVADKGGFRAQINTNEPGTKVRY